MNRQSSLAKSSQSQKRENWLISVIREPLKDEETSSSLLMTTLSRLLIGFIPSLTSSQILSLQASLAQLLSGKRYDATGTFSNTEWQRSYTISYFVKGENLCLAISCVRVRGQLEQAFRYAIMKVKSTFWKLAIWLGVERYLMK